MIVKGGKHSQSDDSLQLQSRTLALFQFKFSSLSLENITED